MRKAEKKKEEEIDFQFFHFHRPSPLDLFLLVSLSYHVTRANIRRYTLSLSLEYIVFYVTSFAPELSWVGLSWIRFGRSRHGGVMGCCQSSLFKRTRSDKDRYPQTTGLNHTPPSNGTDAAAAGVGDGGEGAGGVPAFSEFSLADLKAATNNFSSDFIVSESGEKAPNVVYKGRLQNRRWIAVKKFTKLAWPDPKQFAVLD